MRTARFGRARRALAGMAGLLASVTVAVAPVAGPAAASGGRPGASSQVPVAYSCFVTFPGGSTYVSYGLTFDVSAPATVRRGQPFRAVLDAPPITPNPTLQSDVRDVEVDYRLPANAVPVAWWLSGGDLGSSRATVVREGDVLLLRAAGPFPAGQVFDLPALNVVLLAVGAGAAQTATGGTSYDDPSFSWTRNSLSPGDPPGTLRPFQCQPPEPVVFTTTNVTP
jgi:dehydratase